MTRAVPDGDDDGAWRITGHKWFFSAPQCDAHLVLAQTHAGLGCFLMPRMQPDGCRNTIRVDRLKDKVGNRSNASAEVQFDDAFAWAIGPADRGIATILEMVQYTRLDCVIGSAGLMRGASSWALHHARHRTTFGRRLVDHPLMANVLADMALESEAAMLLAMLLARASEREADGALKAVARILTPAAKFWVCKRAMAVTSEAMEALGGNGYIEEAPLARFYREAPVNSIWEGSGNVMCLDMLRAIERETDGFLLLLDHLDKFAAGHAGLNKLAAALRHDLSAPPEQREALARRFTQRLVLAVQGMLMLESAPTDIAEAFIASRIDLQCGRVYGTLAASSLQKRILDRAWPM